MNGPPRGTTAKNSFNEDLNLVPTDRGVNWG